MFIMDLGFILYFKLREVILDVLFFDILYLLLEIYKV